MPPTSRAVTASLLAAALLFPDRSHANEPAQAPAPTLASAAEPGPSPDRAHIRRGRIIMYTGLGLYGLVPLGVIPLLTASNGQGILILTQDELRRYQALVATGAAMIGTGVVAGTALTLAGAMTIGVGKERGMAPSNAGLHQRGRIIAASSVATATLLPVATFLLFANIWASSWSPLAVTSMVVGNVGTAALLTTGLSMMGAANTRERKRLQVASVRPWFGSTVAGLHWSGRF